MYESRSNEHIRVNYMNARAQDVSVENEAAVAAAEEEAAFGANDDDMESIVTTESSAATPPTDGSKADTVNAVKPSASNTPDPNIAQIVNP